MKKKDTKDIIYDNYKIHHTKLGKDIKPKKHDTKEWVSVNDLIDWIDNKIEKIDQRSQTDEQKRVAISCLNCLRDILKGLGR